MCNLNGIIFGAVNLKKDDIEAKKVIEIGSCDINGTLRPIIESHRPGEYIGIDINEGPGVDMICRVEDVLERFGLESFDLVIATELLEHIKDWRSVISNIKNLCRTDGVILITTRSKGFKYHGFPHDYWRFETEDMGKIFSDCIIEKLEEDPTKPGVLIKVKKPEDFSENDLTGYRIYSVIAEKTVVNIDDTDIVDFHKKYYRNSRLKKKAKSFLNNHVLQLLNAVIDRLFKI